MSPPVFVGGEVYIQLVNMEVLIFKNLPVLFRSTRDSRRKARVFSGIIVADSPPQ